MLFKVVGSLKEFLDLATLSEEPMEVKTDTEMIKLLLQGHEHLIREIRGFIEKIREEQELADSDIKSGDLMSAMAHKLTADWYSSIITLL